MPDFSKHSVAVEKLTAAQDVETDNRERAREAHLFVDKRDGQWEQTVINNLKDQPRYTFDQVGPIIDQISGEIDKADFDIKVRPAGGEASKDTAEILDGMIRNIENISNASTVFSAAGRGMITSGIDGWRVKTDFIDGDSFDQDLLIDPIRNFADRVWFDPGAENQDKSDANYCYVLQSMTKDAYDEKFPDGSSQSLSEGRDSSSYTHKKEEVIVGQIYFKEFKDHTFHLMTNGAIYEDDDDFEKVRDELAGLNITVDRSRTRKKTIVVIRTFDAGDWLDEAKDTVFSHIPVIPTYANYKIVENKAIYRGAVEKLIDPQRVLNYSLSREIAEGALAPRAKYWMTRKQAAGNEDTLQTMNTNQDPIQFYTPDSEAPGPPQQNGGAQVNPGLRTISEGMQVLIGRTAGLFAANMGDNPNLQSGVAIESLQERGDTGTIKYFTSQEIAICHTARILIDAIPKVYDSRRQVRILNEDGSFDMKMLNDTILDKQTQQQVTLNDLSIGTYDVTCKAGKSFKNRQSESQAAFLEHAAVDSTIMQIGGDILLANSSSPSMDKVAERVRKRNFEGGVIPETQWTDEEKQKVLKAQQKAEQQPPQPDALMVAAQAEMQKAQAEQQVAEIKGMEVQIKAQQAQLDFSEKSAKLQLAQVEQERKNAETRSKIAMDQAKLDETVKQNRVDNMIASLRVKMDKAVSNEERVKIQAEVIKIHTEAMRNIREAAGIDSFTGPGIADNFITQSDIVSESQEAQDTPLRGGGEINPLA